MTLLFSRRMVCLAVLLGVALSAAGLLAPATGGKPPQPPPPPPPLPPIRYTIKWLQPLPEGTMFTTALAIQGMNDLGQLVGTTWRPASDDPTKLLKRAYVWAEETGMVDLNDLLPPNSGWNLRRAFGINNLGQIVGDGYYDADGDGHFDVDQYGQPKFHAFRFTPGDPPIVEDLGTLPEAVPILQPTAALAINDNGDVTGSAVDAARTSHAFVCGGPPGWLGPIVPIDDQANVVESWGHAINIDGQVAGQLSRPDKFGTSHLYGFRYTPPSQIETFVLVEPNYFTFSDAKDINDHGQVAGYAYPKPRSQSHAIRCTEGLVLDLGAFGSQSDGNGINSDGDVVGYSGSRGFIYKEGFGLLNLDDLVELFPGDALLWALPNVVPQKINASGQICGFVTDGTLLFPFLLTPMTP